MRRSVSVGAGFAVSLILLGAGYLIGMHNTESRCLADLADNAVSGLHAHYFVLSRLAKGEIDDAKMILASLADADLEKIINYGNLVDRPGHKEYRSVLLREYRQFRKENSLLYQVPTYLTAEEAEDWRKMEKMYQEYLDKNRAKDGVKLGQ